MDSGCFTLRFRVLHLRGIMVIMFPLGVGWVLRLAVLQILCIIKNQEHAILGFRSLTW